MGQEFDFDCLFELIDRASRARQIAHTIHDQQASRALTALAAELDEQIGELAQRLIGDCLLRDSEDGSYVT
jgi:hypothetical protein